MGKHIIKQMNHQLLQNQRKQILQCYLKLENTLHNFQNGMLMVYQLWIRKEKKLMDLAIVENENVPVPTVPKTEPPPEVKLRVENAAWQEILDNAKETLIQEAQQKVIKEFEEGKRLPPELQQVLV